jgi:murein L,D-transpeptidase YcbB/YkuD
MENFKFILGSLVVLALVGLGGYWAFSTIQSGGEYVSTKKIKDLQSENEELKDEVKKLKDELLVLQPEVKEEESVSPIQPEPKPVVAVYKNQTLIDELQELIDDKIFLKLKSAGTRVGTVQNFLNIYNKTSNRVDNDYGASTKTAVAAFQKAQGLTSDGEAGPSTFMKMIDWLKKQG